MIRIKIYKMFRGHVKVGNRYCPVTDYLYSVYFLGFLIHSVTLHNVKQEAAELMFKGKKIYG